MEHWGEQGVGEDKEQQSLLLGNIFRIRGAGYGNRVPRYYVHENRKSMN